MDIEKNPKQLLKVSVEILEKSYKLAKKKDDIEGMLAISDRLMLLYNTLEELKSIKDNKPRVGFGLLGVEDDD